MSAYTWGIVTGLVAPYVIVGTVAGVAYICGSLAGTLPWQWRTDSQIDRDRLERLDAAVTR